MALAHPKQARPVNLAVLALHIGDRDAGVRQQIRKPDCRGLGGSLGGRIGIIGADLHAPYPLIVKLARLHDRLAAFLNCGRSELQRLLAGRKNVLLDHAAGRQIDGIGQFAEAPVEQSGNLAVPLLGRLATEHHGDQPESVAPRRGGEIVSGSPDVACLQAVGALIAP